MKYILSIATVFILAGAGCSSAPTTPATETPATPPPVEIQEPATSTPTVPPTTTSTTAEPVVQPTPTEKPTVTAPVVTAPVVPTPAVKSYTMTEVAAANTESNCLTVINGIVYNLTAFVNKHPGGDRNILRICGKDGTSAFNGQHGGESKPEKMLATFDVGVLAQ